MGAANILYKLRMTDYLRKDPGNAGTIRLDDASLAVFPLVSAEAETRTLAQPTKAGLIVTVEFDTDVGSITLTVTGGYDPDANTTIVLDDAGDFVTFISIKVGSSYYWRVLQSSGTPAREKIFLYPVGSAANSASGLLMGVGTTANPATTSTANAKFIEIRAGTTATSGDNRLAYLQYSIGAAGGGECLRANTIIDGNTGTAHGAHIGMEFVATAGGSECSGLGAVVRGTLMIPNVASWAPTGTYCAGMFEIYSVGANSDPAGMTELSVLRLCNSGDATGAADIDTDAFLFSIQGFTAAGDTTKLLSSVSLAELPGSSVAVRCKIGATTYYLPLVLASELN